MEHSSLHGVYWTFHDLGDFLTGVIEVVGELKHQALLDRQRCQPAFKHFTVKRCVQVIDDGRVGIAHLKRHRARVRGGATNQLECATVGNADDPGRDTRRVTEFTSLLPHDPQRVVDDLLGVLATSRQSRQKTTESAVVANVEIPECIPVAGADFAQQFDLKVVR